MSIINAVAKSVPQPHKVDLKNPDKTIIVQIVKVSKVVFLLSLKLLVLCFLVRDTFSFDFTAVIVQALAIVPEIQVCLFAQ